jgi:phosphoribosylformimino-5-aminoimidazole carboxamide ribotide isomerase
MEVIPVIDLKCGKVVHARRGLRESYQPIQTPLAAGSEPAAVVAGLLRLAPFGRMYIADLDAIEARGSHDGVIASLSAAFPRIELWVDSGASDADAWLASRSGCLVIGSESQTDTALLRRLRGNPRIMLSLDFRDDVFQGPRAILDDPNLWPTRVIVMTLARVGAGAGPDVDQVAAVVQRAAGRPVYAAGGVRGAADLHQLAAIGATGALVATALHNGTITARDIVRPDGRTISGNGCNR